MAGRVLGQPLGHRFVWPVAALRVIEFALIAISAFLAVRALRRRVQFSKERNETGNNAIIHAVRNEIRSAATNATASSTCFSKYSSLGLHAQKVVQRWSGSAERIVGRHKAIGHKRIHQQPLIDHFFEFHALGGQVAVVVIGHNNPIIFAGQLCK